MNILSYAKRALSLPPHILLQKIIHKVKKGCIKKKKEYADRRCSTYMKQSPFSSLNNYVQTIDISSLPEAKIAELNEHFLKHEFNLLGSGWVTVSPQMICKGMQGHLYLPTYAHINKQNFSESNRIRSFIQQPYTPIDWHIDFKSGYRWNEDTWSEHIQYGHLLGVDVKVPWELSRMQHLTTLAWGYASSRQSPLLIEFQNQILDFISANPPRFGVNWTCTMDVGIRIANWLIAYDLFSAFGAVFPPEFQSIFIRSVYEHGHHIYNHLEWDPHLRSNHYLANIAGLLFVGAYLPSDPEIDSWLQFSAKELQSEVMLQFNADGSNFEASTSYHRLSTEMVVYATALALEKKIDFSKEYLDRVQKMGDFIRDITKPDGQIMQIGDNDSGRFIKFFPDSHLLDHRHLVASIRNLKTLTDVIEAELNPGREEPKGTSCYPDFGLFIRNTSRWCLGLRSGSIGQKGNGGHAHNDQLSFELSVDGISLLIDPGTYVYTPLPKERRRFRSTAMHNTLAIEGREQNKEEGLFKMSDRAKAEVIQFDPTIFIGEHRGFGPTHRRTVKVLENSIEGIDECDAGPKQIFFHFAPGWRAAPNEMAFSFNGLTVEMIYKGAWSVSEGDYSDAYGEKRGALVLILYSDSMRTSWTLQISQSLNKSYKCQKS
jgi:hypothetical protein